MSEIRVYSEFSVLILCSKQNSVILAALDRMQFLTMQCENMKWSTHKMENTTVNQKKLDFWKIQREFMLDTKQV